MCNSACPRRRSASLERFGFAPAFLLILVLVLAPAARADMTYMLAFSGGITGSGTFVTKDVCPVYDLTWPSPQTKTICTWPNDWLSLDIGIYTPENGFTNGPWQVDEDIMYPGPAWPPYFYPTEMAFDFAGYTRLVTWVPCGQSWAQNQCLASLDLSGTGAGIWGPGGFVAGTLTITRAPEPGSVGLLLSTLGMIGLRMAYVQGRKRRR